MAEDRGPIGIGWSSRRTWDMNVWLTTNFCADLARLARTHRGADDLALEIRALAKANRPPVPRRRVNWREIAVSWYERATDYGIALY